MKQQQGTSSVHHGDGGNRLIFRGGDYVGTVRHGASTSEVRKQYGDNAAAAYDRSTSRDGEKHS